MARKKKIATKPLVPWWQVRIELLEVWSSGAAPI
jgi:hypothetical protein